MRHIKQFGFIEKIATKGLDRFYEENYSDDFMLSQFRDGVNINVVCLEQVGDTWKITKKQLYASKQLAEISWHFDTKGEVSIPTEESIEKFLIENHLLNQTAFDWKAFRYSKSLNEVYYEVHIRHFSQNPLEFSKHSKFEVFYQLYFDFHFKNLSGFLKRIVNQDREDFVDFEENEELSFYDILLYEPKLEKVFNQFITAQSAQYKEKIYDEFKNRVKNLFLDLKHEFPILYNDQVEQHPEELYNIHKLRWYSLNDIFFLLFSELNEAGIIRNHQNRVAKFYGLARILMQSFEISPKTGQKNEYTPQSFEKMLQIPVSVHNGEKLNTIKKLIKQLVKEIHNLD